jgi:hypothetical protein
MKHFDQFWKSIPYNEKTTQDIVYRIALKAWFAKSNTSSKEGIFKSLFSAAFTPVTNKKKLNNGAAPLGAITNAFSSLYFYKSKLGIFRLSYEDTVQNIFNGSVEDYEMFFMFIRERFKEIKTTPDRYGKRYYSYIFVDQDGVEPIYQAVQAAHAAMLVGQLMSKEHDARHIYFQVCKKPDNWEYSMDEFETYLDTYYRAEAFYEPDVDRIIAVATHPIRSDKRQKLLQYELLSF